MGLTEQRPIGPDSLINAAHCLRVCLWLSVVFRVNILVVVVNEPFADDVLIY